MKLMLCLQQHNGNLTVNEVAQCTTVHGLRDVEGGDQREPVLWYRSVAKPATARTNVQSCTVVKSPVSL